MFQSLSGTCLYFGLFSAILSCAMMVICCGNVSSSTISNGVYRKLVNTVTVKNTTVYSGVNNVSSLIESTERVFDGSVKEWKRFNDFEFNSSPKNMIDRASRQKCFFMFESADSFIDCIINGLSNIRELMPSSSLLALDSSYSYLFMKIELIPVVSFLRMESIQVTAKQSTETPTKSPTPSVQQVPLYPTPPMKAQVPRHIPFQRKENHTFFPWNDDDIDYEKACNSILSIFRSFKGPIIVNSGYHGGIGHKFVSMYYAISIALLLGRPFYIDFDPIYLKNLNSCFNSLQYKGSTSKFLHCRKDRKCFSNSTIESLRNRNVILYDNRFYGGGLKNIYNLRKLNKFNIIGRRMTWDEYKRVLYRLIANPTSEVMNAILNKRVELEPISNLLGIHLRCGGELADTKEVATVISWKQLETIPKQIESVASEIGKNITIYLSTDSSKAEEFIRNSLPDYTIITLTSYHRGHTTLKTVSEDSLKRAIIDLFLLSQTRQCMITQNSGFSETAVVLGAIPHKYIIHSSLKRG